MPKVSLLLFGGSKSGATHFSGNGEFLKFEHPVGDSIIDLGESRHKMGRRDPIRLPGPVFQN